MNGQIIATINLNESLMYPDFVCFSPTNWRNLTIAYKTEINVWKLEQFDNHRFKTNNTRLLLPLTDDQVMEEEIGSGFIDEFTYPKNSIANLPENYEHLVDEILDQRKRHFLRAICWSNIDEFLISTSENYIFKVNLKL